MEVLIHSWADVWVEDFDDRYKLQQKALFFIPQARELAIEHGINNAGLASLATFMKGEGSSELAGIAVIRSVLGCKQPVSYDSALRFIRLMNHKLPHGRKLTSQQIVACVFRLRDTEIIDALQVTHEMIAAECKLSLQVVRAAMKRMRITYRDAHDIWTYLSSVAANISKTAHLPESVTSVLTGDQTSFIVSDSSDNYTLAIEKAGPSTPRHSKKGGFSPEQTADYVYSRPNLRFAPTTGHPWAIAKIDDTVKVQTEATTAAKDEGEADVKK